MDTLFGQLLAVEANKSGSSGQQEAVNQILAGGQHLLSLINDLLDLARIESGHIAMKIEHLDARGILNETRQFASPVAEQEEVSINQDYNGANLPPVLADRKQLRQVLLNLITNGIKYNKPGGTVTLGCAMLASGMMRFSIADTGRGIPKDLQPRIFEPFDRLGIEASEIEGTGIGLFITKSLVEKMDGILGFVSVEGEGSTFWVDLPVVSEDE